MWLQPNLGCVKVSRAMLQSHVQSLNSIIPIPLPLPLPSPSSSPSLSIPSTFARWRTTMGMMRSRPTPTFWSKGRCPHLAVSPRRCCHPPTPYSKVCFSPLCFADPLTFGTHTGIVSHATTMSHTGSLSIGAPFFCCIFILADSSPLPWPPNRLHFDGWSHPLHAPTSRVHCFAMPHQPWKHGAWATVAHHHPAPTLPSCHGEWVEGGPNLAATAASWWQWRNDEAVVMTWCRLRWRNQHSGDERDDTSMAATTWWERDSRGRGGNY